MIINRLPKTYDGYTLIVPNGPINSVSGDHSDEYAYLINMDKRVSHKWHFEGGFKHAILLDNGNLLCRTRAPRRILDSVVPIAGSSGSLVELDWEGNIVWQYHNSSIHHDFERLDNGNTLLLAWEPIPNQVTYNIQGGTPQLDDQMLMLGDKILEINQYGDIVWEWKSWEYLDFGYHRICPLENRIEWTHANSIQLMSDGNILLSFRNTNTLVIVSRADGSILWEWGYGELEHQHHPTEIEHGKIMLLDNRPHEGNGARIITIDIAHKKILSEYKGEPGNPFFAVHAGSVDQLPNGNLLICQGSEGKAFEIDGAGSILWEYTNPYFIPNQLRELNNGLFRVHRYPSDHPLFENKKL